MNDTPVVALLTTDTSHHRYFAWKVQARVPLSAIFLERDRVRAKFPTAHPFESDRDEYERRTLLPGAPEFGEVTRTVAFDSMNQPEVVSALQAVGPDVIVVFGTGKLRPEVAQGARCACVNLHGGHPEYYRGLDCHLWTIYREDFARLVTTLHVVEPSLDTGPIVGQAPLPLSRGMRLHELRAVSTRACVDLVVSALEEVARTGTLSSRPQARRGEYFSFMPADLKDECVRRFDGHIASL